MRRIRKKDHVGAAIALFVLYFYTAFRLLQITKVKRSVESALLLHCLSALFVSSQQKIIDDR